MGFQRCPNGLQGVFGAFQGFQAFSVACQGASGACSGGSGGFLRVSEGLRHVQDCRGVPSSFIDIPGCFSGFHERWGGFS